MASLRRGVLIKRYDLPAVYRKVVVNNDPDNYFDNLVTGYTSHKFHVTGCTIQIAKDWDYSIVEQGISVDQVYQLITATPLTAPTDGGSNLGCSVYIPEGFFTYDAPVGFPVFENQGGWYRVVSPNNSNNGIQSHCKAYLVKDTTLVDDNNVAKYPDMVTVEALMQTRTELLANTWKTEYIPD